jgi:hypothetical protein
MTTPVRIAAGLFASLAIACSAVVPARINVGDQCFRCARNITDTRLAGEQIGAFVEKFRAPGCMAKYVVKNPDDRGAIFVTDYASGKMLPPAEAFFVPVVLDEKTGERDYRAYSAKDAATAAAAEARTEVVDWNTVLDRARAN